VDLRQSLVYQQGTRGGGLPGTGSRRGPVPLGGNRPAAF